MYLGVTQSYYLEMQHIPQQVLRKEYIYRERKLLRWNRSNDSHFVINYLSENELF